jgi:hypothetical protein
VQGGLTGGQVRPVEVIPARRLRAVLAAVGVQAKARLTRVLGEHKVPALVGTDAAAAGLAREQVEAEER